jgi:hypothetical protein
MISSMNWWWSSVNPTGRELDFETAHRVGCLPTWLIGYVFPVVVGGLGVWSVVARRSWIPGRQWSLPIWGDEAVAMGVGLIGAALGIHAFFVWRYARGLWRVADGVILAALLAVVGGFGYAIVVTAIQVFS